MDGTTLTETGTIALTVAMLTAVASYLVVLFWQPVCACGDRFCAHLSSRSRRR